MNQKRSNQVKLEFIRNLISFTLSINLLKHITSGLHRHDLNNKLETSSALLYSHLSRGKEG